LPHDVFISHKSEDRRIVNKVISILQDVNIRCWVSHKDIPEEIYKETDLWPPLINQAIDTARVIVLVLSEKARNSDFITYEITRARKEDKPVIIFSLGEKIGLPQNLTKEVVEYFDEKQRIEVSSEVMSGYVRKNWECDELIEEQIHNLYTAVKYILLFMMTFRI